MKNECVTYSSTSGDIKRKLQMPNIKEAGVVFYGLQQSCRSPCSMTVQLLKAYVQKVWMNSQKKNPLGDTNS